MLKLPRLELKHRKFHQRHSSKKKKKKLKNFILQEYASFYLIQFTKNHLDS